MWLSEIQGAWAPLPQGTQHVEVNYCGCGPLGALSVQHSIQRRGQERELVQEPAWIPFRGKVAGGGKK